MTDAPRVAGISGSPGSPSRSKTLLEALLDALSQRGCFTDLVDLSQLPAEALLARSTDRVVDEALASVREAKIVIAATPTYRALYTGLLKCFFDLMPQSFLTGKLCIGVQTAAVPHHALAIEYGLRPLFSSLDGTPLGALFATDDQFVDGRPSPVLLERADHIAEQALALLR